MRRVKEFNVEISPMTLQWSDQCLGVDSDSVFVRFLLLAKLAV